MLAYDFYPGKSPHTVVMLHGLFGSARNLKTQAEGLLDLAQVYAYDARNHGRSVHTATHTLADLVEDLAGFISQHGIQKPVLWGHSMGGLTAMRYAQLYPDHVAALVVLDIAPRSYPAGHEREIAAQKIDVSQFSTRREIDQEMAKWIPDPQLRQFLQMNIARDQAGKFYWQNNIAAIENSPERTLFPDWQPPLFTGPVLAIRGLLSDFVRDTDVELLHKAFPQLELHSLPAAHWLHFSHAESVLKLVRDFLRRLWSS
ncbi:MAG: alpha/beta fold hydrolase [Leptospiraceae bacterium]|nr:alpha/beta fold hydrolase [Leptospiraceae bacterium]